MTIDKCKAPYCENKENKAMLRHGDLDAIERIVFSLRALYCDNGYQQYKMGKFEEYDFYSRNKDFLVSDGIITFTDTNGKLMAMKPDVTLSIIKNSEDSEGIRKLYYDENVYRVSKGTNSFREIKQTGLECLGEVDTYCKGEVLLLAAKSLTVASEGYVLDVSHLGIIAKFVAAVSENKEICAKLLKCIGEKNMHGITEICRENEIDEATAEPLRKLVSLYGAPADVIAKLEQMTDASDISEEIAELKGALSVFADSEEIKHINIDFSVVGDFNYYNGIVFKGFINGIPDSVLSGGQYDKLMTKLGRRSSAIGFAVYLDLLERLDDSSEQYDVDVMLIGGDDVVGTRRAAEKLISEGNSVLVVRKKDNKLKYKVLAEYKGGEVRILENNA